MVVLSAVALATTYDPSFSAASCPTISDADIAVVGRVVELGGHARWPFGEDRFGERMLVEVDEGILGADAGDTVEVWAALGSPCGLSEPCLLVGVHGWVGNEGPCGFSERMPDAGRVGWVRTMVGKLPSERRRSVHGRYRVGASWWAPIGGVSALAVLLVAWRSRASRSS